MFVIIFLSLNHTELDVSISATEGLIQWSLLRSLNTALLVHIYVAFSLYRRSVRKKSLCTPESTDIASIPRSEGFVRGGAEGALAYGLRTPKEAFFHRNP